jgi:hypothetical protein
VWKEIANSDVAQASVDAASSGGTGEPIDVRADNERVALIQLAARWSESFAPRDADSPQAALDHFHRVYNYLDAVVHGIEPPELR